MNAVPRSCLLLVQFVLLAAVVSAAAPGDETLSDVEQLNELIDGLYATVSFEAGETPDWDRARSFFLPEAVVVFAPRFEGTAQIMDLEGWIEDFVAFYVKRDLAKKGFRETIVGRELSIYGNIAHAFVVFEPRVGPDWTVPTVPGVDAIDLVKHEGRWWIASITTQFSSDRHPIPARFYSH